MMDWYPPTLTLQDGRLVCSDPAFRSATLTVTATLGDRAVTKTLTLYPPMTVARVDWTPRRTTLWPGDVLEAASLTILVNRGGGQQLLTDHSEVAFRLTASGPTGYWSAEGTALAIPRNAVAATLSVFIEARRRDLQPNAVSGLTQPVTLMPLGDCFNQMPLAWLEARLPGAAPAAPAAPTPSKAPPPPPAPGPPQPPPPASSASPSTSPTDPRRRGSKWWPPDFDREDARVREGRRANAGRKRRGLTPPGFALPPAAFAPQEVWQSSQRKPGHSAREGTDVPGVSADVSRRACVFAVPPPPPLLASAAKSPRVGG